MEQQPEEPENGWMPGLKIVLIAVVAYFLVRLLDWSLGGVPPWKSW